MELTDNIGPTSTLNTSDEESKECNKEDVTDVPPRSSKISNFDIFVSIVSLIVHFIDVGVDTNLVVQYYLNDKIKTFAWTILLILVPSFINTIVSLQMYSQDEERCLQKNENKEKSKSVFKMIGKVIIIIFTVTFQCTMAQRCFLSLKYALQSRQCKKRNDIIGQRTYFIKMLKEEQDIALLRVLECFIEAAPQQILQLSLFVQDYYGESKLMTLHQLISIGSSFVSLAWAMTSYHRSIRLAQLDKKNINLMGSILQFLWHLFITTSRIACVSAVAIFSSLAVTLACFFHWLGMTTWIIMESRGIVMFCQEPNHTPHLPLSIKERIKSTLFSCVFGFVYIFIYLNHEDSNTYSRHLFYYTICLLENISASILVLLSLPSNVTIVWYHYVISAVCIIPFLAGITIMIFYYIKFHPSMKQQTFSFSKLLKVR